MAEISNKIDERAQHRIATEEGSSIVTLATDTGLNLQSAEMLGESVFARQARMAAESTVSMETEPSKVEQPPPVQDEINPEAAAAEEAPKAAAEKEEPLPEQIPKQEATAEAEASSKVAETSEIDSIREKAAAVPEEDPVEVMRKKVGSAILAASKDGSLAEKLQHGEDALRALREDVKPSESSKTAAPPPPAQEEMKPEVAAVEEAPKELPTELPGESIRKKAGIALLAATKDGTLAEKLQQVKAQSTSDAVTASPAEEPKAADAELEQQVTLKDGEPERFEDIRKQAGAAILDATRDGSLADKLQEVKTITSKELTSTEPPAIVEAEEAKIEDPEVEEASSDRMDQKNDGVVSHEESVEFKAEAAKEATKAKELKAEEPNLEEPTAAEEGKPSASQTQEEAEIKEEANAEAKEAEIQEEAKEEEAEAKKGDALLQEQNDEEIVPRAEEPKPEDVKVSYPSSPEAEEAHPEVDEAMSAEIQEKVTEAIEENNRLRTENEALRVELEKLLTMTITPDNTPPGTAGR